MRTSSRLAIFSSPSPSRLVRGNCLRSMTGNRVSSYHRHWRMFLRWENRSHLHDNDFWLSADCGVLENVRKRDESSINKFNVLLRVDPNAYCRNQNNVRALNHRRRSHARISILKVTAENNIDSSHSIFFVSMPTSF